MKVLSKDIGRCDRLVYRSFKSYLSSCQAQFNCADNLLQEISPSLGLCAALRGSANQLNISRNPLKDQKLVRMLQGNQLGIENLMDYLEEVASSLPARI